MIISYLALFFQIEVNRLCKILLVTAILLNLRTLLANIMMLNSAVPKKKVWYQIY